MWLRCLVVGRVAVSSLGSEEGPGHIGCRFDLIFFTTTIVFNTVFCGCCAGAALRSILTRRGTIISARTSGRGRGSVGGRGASMPRGVPRIIPRRGIGPIPRDRGINSSCLRGIMFVNSSLACNLSACGVIPSSGMLTDIDLGLTGVSATAMSATCNGLAVISTLARVRPGATCVVLNSGNVTCLGTGRLCRCFSAFVGGILSMYPRARVCVVSIPPIATRGRAAIGMPVGGSSVSRFGTGLLRCYGEGKLGCLSLGSSLGGRGNMLTSRSTRGSNVRLGRSACAGFASCVLARIRGWSCLRAGVPSVVIRLFSLSDWC